MKREISIDAAHRLISAGPLALVTSFHRGDMNVMTAGWFSPVSYRPVLVGLSVHQATMTHDLIKKGGEFALNIPTWGMIRQVKFCGAISGRDQNKMRATGLHEEGPRHIRPILIQECIAHLECAVVNAVTPGDHTIFIAEVVSAQVEEEAFDETYLLRERDLRPLHHLGGERYSVLDEVLTSDAALPASGEER